MANKGLKKLKRVVKNKREVKDPPRYPKVISGYEGEAMQLGKEFINRTLTDLTKEMVKQVKKK